MCEKYVSAPIPHTQDRPICVNVNAIIVTQPTTSRRQVNTKKANCDAVSTEFDAAIEEVNSIPENYGRLIKLQRVVSRRHIPGARGRKCTSQQLNLNQHIEDGYQRNMITGAADDTVNHRILTQKLYNTGQSTI